MVPWYFAACVGGFANSVNNSPYGRALPRAEWTIENIPLNNSFLIQHEIQQTYYLLSAFNRLSDSRGRKIWKAATVQPVILEKCARKVILHILINKLSVWCQMEADCFGKHQWSIIFWDKTPIIFTSCRYCIIHFLLISRNCLQHLHVLVPCQCLNFPICIRLLDAF